MFLFGCSLPLKTAVFCLKWQPFCYFLTEKIHAIRQSYFFRVWRVASVSQAFLWASYSSKKCTDKKWRAITDVNNSCSWCRLSGKWFFQELKVALIWKLIHVVSHIPFKECLITAFCKLSHCRSIYTWYYLWKVSSFTTLLRLGWN